MIRAVRKVPIFVVLLGLAAFFIYSLVHGMSTIGLVGIVIIFVGASLNFLVMSFNGNRMPIECTEEEFKSIDQSQYTPLTNKTRLRMLADIYNYKIGPVSLEGVSLGDQVMFGGVVILIIASLFT